MPRKKTQTRYNIGKKKQTGQSDTELLIYIRQYLKRRWHLDFKREWYIGFDLLGRVKVILEHVNKDMADDYKWRNPDLLTFHKDYGLIVIEVDGSIHDRQVEKTIQRNQRYITAGIKLIVLNLAEIKFNNETLEDALDGQLRKIFARGVVEKDKR